MFFHKAHLTSETLYRPAAADPDWWKARQPRRWSLSRRRFIPSLPKKLSSAVVRCKGLIPLQK
jgi:hypothetical protein